jgi:3-oxoacyl-(acyl-carrier-protein) synthase
MLPRPSQKNPVYIRGMGLTSCLGPDLATAVAHIRTGKTGLKKIEHTPYVFEFDMAAGEAELDVPLEERPIAMLQRAVDEALALANYTADERESLGIFLGTTSCFAAKDEIKRYLERDCRTSEAAASDFSVRGSGEISLWASEYIQSGGPLTTYSVACTSSALALIEATHAIQLGHIDRAVVIGYETLLNTSLHGFKSLMLYSSSGYRPFDKDRQGLQLGEGCGVILLDKNNIHKDGLSIIDGATYSTQSDVLTGADTSGKAVEQIVGLAIERAGIKASDVIAIKAHGTGTVDNDIAEFAGFKSVFGLEHMPRYASLKGYIGHCLGAAGSMEAALWMASLRDGFIPQSCGFQTPDEKIEVSPTREACYAASGYYVLNYFGFSGSCAAVVLKYDAP